MDNGAAALGLSWLSCLCFCVNNGAEKSLLSKPIKAFLLCNVSVSRCTHLSPHPVSVSLWLHILLSAVLRLWLRLTSRSAESEATEESLLLTALYWPGEAGAVWGETTVITEDRGWLSPQNSAPASQQVTAASAGLLRLLPAAGPCHCLHSLRPVPVCCRTLAALHSGVKTRHWLTQAPWAGPTHVSAPALVL